MPSKATVIDCGEHCRKAERECRQSGRSESACREQRDKCRTVCAFK